MRLKIIKIGDQFVLPLPEKGIKALQLSDGSEVLVTVEEDNHWILISLDDGSLDLEEIDVDLARMLNEFIEEYREALEELANLKPKKQ